MVTGMRQSFKPWTGLSGADHHATRWTCLIKQIDGKTSYVDFYKFVADPIYKSFEKRLAFKCRNSKKYRKKLFEKIAILINNLDEKENKTIFDMRFFERYDSIS